MTPPSESQVGSPEGDAAPEAPSPYQQALLPRTAPRVEGYDVAGGTAVEASRPGATVWLTLTLPEQQTALAAIAVQDSKSPPGIALSVARAFLMEAARTAETPASILAGANDALSRTALPDGSQLVACALLVPTDGTVAWSCAGPMHGGVIRRAGSFDGLTSHGPPLGMLPGFQYGVTSLELGPGDEILVMSGSSDGLFRGAADLVASMTGKPAGEVVTTVHKAIRKAQPDSPIETSVLFLRKH